MTVKELINLTKHKVLFDDNVGCAYRFFKIYNSYLVEARTYVVSMKGKLKYVSKSKFTLDEFKKLLKKNNILQLKRFWLNGKMLSYLAIKE